MEDQLVFVFRLLGFPGGSEKKESKVAQSCLTLCDPMDCSPPGSSVQGILQARILEWVVYCSVSPSIMSDSLHPVDCNCQAPPFMEFFRQEYWSGFPFPSPEDLPDLGIKPRSPASQADSLLPELPGKPMSPALIECTATFPLSSFCLTFLLCETGRQKLQ